MVRDNSNDLLFQSSVSTPVIAFQHNDFKEGYFNGSISIHHGRHEWKAGVRVGRFVLARKLQHGSRCTDPQTPCASNWHGTPRSFAFTGSRPDLEQSAFVQDAIRLGKWTVNAGLRWDHYQLLVNQNALSPRLCDLALLSLSWISFFTPPTIAVFQTPSFENILLSSSSAAEALDTSVSAVTAGSALSWQLLRSGLDERILRE